MPCCLAPHPCCAWTEKAPGIPCTAAYCTAGAQIHVLGLLAPCCTRVTKTNGTGKLFPPGSHRRDACTGGMQGSCSGHPRPSSALSSGHSHYYLAEQNSGPTRSSPCNRIPASTTCPLYSVYWKGEFNPNHSSLARVTCHHWGKDEKPTRKKGG